MQFFFGLYKAFDSVDRRFLLRKSEFYGVRSDLHLLIRYYLTKKNNPLAFEDMNQPVKK